MNNIFQVSIPVCNILDKPNGNLIRQMLYGDRLECISDIGEWIKCKRYSDGYGGYVKKSNLKNWVISNSKVCSFGAHLYLEPNIKTLPVMSIPFQSELTVVDESRDFFELITGQYIHKMHVEPITETKKDFTKTAEKYLGVPYLWGGNSQYGVDCSGLISLALRNAAYNSPGDSSEQAKELGYTINKNEHLKRSDLIFWEGHVGVMLDEKNLLHANGYHMKVIEEPLKVAKERIETNGGGLITAIKRIIF